MSKSNIGNLKAGEREMKYSDLSSVHHCRSPLQWGGLYDQFDGWKDMVTSQSFVHPAKMAPLLCQKIFEHLEELKMISHDSLVCDFMAGTGTTNIIASLRGYRSVSIELEPRFVRIEAGNRERIARYAGIEPRWRIVQGDSRNLSKMLNDGNITAVMSPSYGGAEVVDHKDGQRKGYHLPVKRTVYRSQKNVGNTDVRMGVISPPYHGLLDRRGKVKDYLPKNAIRSGYGFSEDAPPRSSRNVEMLKTGIISPPYQDIGIRVNPDESFGDLYKHHGRIRENESPIGYNKSNPKNIGNLRAGVVSPPYQDQIASKSTQKDVDYKNRKLSELYGRKVVIKGASQLNLVNQRYGHAKGQIGSMPNETDETYESAMLRIYSEAKKAGISPLAIVTKNPTRKGQIVRLDLITADLLRKSGYQIFDYHQAVLFRSHDETSVDLDMNIREKTSHKGRIGFFRQLSLRKGGVAASWEDVIFAR